MGAAAEGGDGVFIVDGGDVGVGGVGEVVIVGGGGEMGMWEEMGKGKGEKRDGWRGRLRGGGG